jgi:hypothetical protein
MIEYLRKSERELSTMRRLAETERMLEEIRLFLKRE